MRLKFKLSWLIIGLIWVLNVAAQNDPVILSLQNALERAEQNNYEIKIAAAQVDAMRADYHKSAGVLLPRIVLSETFLKTNDPLNVFGIKLKQEIVSAMDFNPLLLNNPDNIENFVSKIEIQQPLINFDGFWGRRAAADGLRAMQYKKERVHNYIRFLVKMSYFKVGLMKSSLNVIHQAHEAALANRKLIKDYFDEGLITRADYLMAEVFVSQLESQQTDTEIQYLNSMDQLKHILGMPENVRLETSDSLRLNEVLAIDKDNPFSIEHRSDIRAFKFKAASLSKIVKMHKLKFLPRLNAFGSFEYNDTEVFGTNASNWMFGLNLQWNIFNGFQNISAAQKASAQYREAKYSYEQAHSKAINEVNGARREVNSALKKVKLANKVVSQSDESLRIIKDRYAKGLEKTTDLLNAETALSNAKLNYLQAVFFYNISLFKLDLMQENNNELKNS